MTTYTGVLERIGNSVVDTTDLHGSDMAWQEYGMLQIGPNLLRKVRTTQDLASFLDIGKEMTLTTYKNGKEAHTLLAIQHAGGPKVKMTLQNFMNPALKLFVAGPLGGMLIGGIVGFFAGANAGFIVGSIMALFCWCMLLNMIRTYITA